MALSAASPLLAAASSELIFSQKPCLLRELKLPITKSYLALQTHYSLSAVSILSTRRLPFELFSAVQEVAVEGQTEENAQGSTDQRRKLFVYNLPWSFTSDDIRNLFGQYGTVKDVEIIKRDGRSRGFSFITMASPEEAVLAIEKLDSFELQGRIIRVALAKSMKKPSRPPPPPTPGETRYKIYASNLAWKARSSNLREFFASCSNPVSCRVVFDSPSGRSAGYGFVSFATMEEAEAALSELDGKELMGRPIKLKMSEKNVNKVGDEPEESPESTKATEDL